MFCEWNLLALIMSARSLLINGRSFHLTCMAYSVMITSVSGASVGSLQEARHVRGHPCPRTGVSADRGVRGQGCLRAGLSY